MASANALLCPKFKTLKPGRSKQTLSQHQLMLYRVVRSILSSPVEVNRPDISLGEAHVGGVCSAQSNTAHQTTHYR